MIKKVVVIILGLLISIYSVHAQSWTQIGQDIDGEAEGDVSGWKVCLSSNGLVLAAGAKMNDGNGSNAGHVRVFEYNSGTWIQIGDDINGETESDSFGSSLSLNADGSIVAIGAPYNDGNGNASGHVRVYQNISGTWTQIGNDIEGTAEDDLFGYSISISADGSILAVGSPYINGNGIDAGQVKVYQNISGTWTQMGNDINGEAESDYSGYSVSLNSDGTILAIGAIYNNGNGSGFGYGHTRVYKNISNNWTQIGDDIDGEAEDDRSSCSVSLNSDGTIIAIGALANDGNADAAGHVRVYQEIEGSWIQMGDDIDGEYEVNWFGESISISSEGTFISIGASANNGNGIDAGHARVYQYIDDAWTQIGEDIDGEAAGDNSGMSVSISSDGSYVAIGAPGNCGNGDHSGHVRVYNINSSSLDKISLNNIKVYPNPTSDIITIDYINSNIQKVSINDLTGKELIKFHKLNSNTIVISELEIGIYILTIQTDNNIFTSKIIKR